MSVAGKGTEKNGRVRESMVFCFKSCVELINNNIAEREEKNTAKFVKDLHFGNRGWEVC